MRKKRFILLAGLLVLILCALGWLVFYGGEPEPSYNGKSLTAWLEDCAVEGPTTQADRDAGNAVRQIGTNAIPKLLKMITAKDSSLRRKWIKLVHAQSLIRVDIHSEDELHNLACAGFYALGSLGKAAVPDLINLLGGTNRQICDTAAACLGNIGPEAKAAVPILIHSINDPDRIVRVSTTIHLARIHSSPELVVPILIANLTPSNAISHVTIWALGAFGAEAKPAVPALVTFLTNNQAYLREAATNALKQIDPEAAAKAGVK